MKPAVQPQTQPAVQSPVASDMVAPRDARYGGAFMRGPAESYRPGYGKTSGPLAGFFDRVGATLSGVTQRAQSKLIGSGKSATAGMSDQELMAIFSGKRNVPASAAGMSQGQRQDINKAMFMAALVSAMNRRKV